MAYQSHVLNKPHEADKPFAAHVADWLTAFVSTVQGAISLVAAARHKTADYAPIINAIGFLLVVVGLLTVYAEMRARKKVHLQ